MNIGFNERDVIDVDLITVTNVDVVIITVLRYHLGRPTDANHCLISN